MEKAVGQCDHCALLSMRRIYSGHPGLLGPLNVFKFYEQGTIITAWIILLNASDLCCTFHKIRWRKVFGCAQVVEDVGIEVTDEYLHILAYSCWGSIRCIVFHTGDLEKLWVKMWQQIHYQCGSKPLPLYLSLYAKFGHEKCTDSKHPYLEIGYKLWRWLHSMLVFKGTQNGRIVVEDFSISPTGSESYCLENV